MLLNEFDSKHDIDSIVNCEVNMEVTQKEKVVSLTNPVIKWRGLWFTVYFQFVYFIIDFDADVPAFCGLR